MGAFISFSLQESAANISIPSLNLDISTMNATTTCVSVYSHTSIQWECPSHILYVHVFQDDASMCGIADSSTLVPVEKENDVSKTATPQVSKLPVSTSSKKPSTRKAADSGRKSYKHLTGSSTKKQPLTILNKK